MDKRRGLVKPYPTIMIRAAFGSEAEDLLRGHAEDQARIFLPNHNDDVLHRIGGQALVNAKIDGIQWAFWELVEPEELAVKFPLEKEETWSQVTHQRLVELVAAFDVVEMPRIGSNSFGEYMFLTLHIGSDFYTFYGLGVRNDGKIMRDQWAYYRAGSHFKNKPVVHHPVAMQAIIDRRREIANWEDPPKSQTQRTDTLLDIAGGDEDFASLLEEEFGDEFDEE